MTYQTTTTLDPNRQARPVTIEPRITLLDAPRNPGGRMPLAILTSEWGDAGKALAQAPVRIEATYTTPRDHGASIEAHVDRPATRQTLALGATRQGMLLSIMHRGVSDAPVDGGPGERLGAVTSIMYATENFLSRQRRLPVAKAFSGTLHVTSETASAFGIECAIDELAIKLGIDPLVMRLLNYADVDPQTNKPWSTRQLREAFAAGAETFGWSRRNPRPCSMREGSELIGYGMAAGTCPAGPSSTEGDTSRHSWCAHFVEVRVDADLGTVRVTRMVSALDSGRVSNRKFAESQWKSGILKGIGQALGKKGCPDIKMISVGIPDYEASTLGGKAVGELGIVGVAPAIANAVFHATGKRVRDLPITVERLS
ncbi:hypothetical protein GCM10007874_24360 [Labrys miyagiensis]|uniref:Uncharacterized protein n=1 Tax=Labrys miyagiensis TaxID=346912 RepID=A0ABQ6CGQ6_9HYPH|nr:hypothetical protein GCM10007874_24360 [Labrys miyagiensis]